MRENYMEIDPLGHDLASGHCTRRCRITRFGGGRDMGQMELWFRVEADLAPPDEGDCDAYLLAVIMDAMLESRDIRIKGSVSGQLLGNLTEYQAAWHKWRPETYHCVEITADTIRPPTLPVSGAVCAFSGGVDAAFSVWRHAQKTAGHRSQDIRQCVMVHGFDIPLQDDAAFANACRRARTILDDVRLDMVPVRTNCRELSQVHWEDFFTCALAAVLCQFKKTAGTCIIGSSEPYDALVIPWGSSPITDHLLGSGDVQVMHDGASHSRTEKVAGLAGWPMACDNLRVCWQVGVTDGNCGVCEKCVRTKLNFLANGLRVPACFADAEVESHLGGVVFRSEAVRAEWRQILVQAQKNGIRDVWVKRVSQMVQAPVPHLKKQSIWSKLLRHGG